VNRTQLKIGIGGTVTALLLLLAYSLERTVWLFGLFEQDQNLAIAAAIVVELAAVALLAGAGTIASLDGQAKAWANRALLAVLSVQALANLSAGYLRGGHKTLWTLGGDWAAYAVALVLWLVANLAVPGLILCLSKLLERMLAKLEALPLSAQKEETQRLRPALAHSKSVGTVAASVVADGVCRYCGAAGLTSIERARHGKAFKKHGACA
jgi:hypothetical protein